MPRALFSNHDTIEQPLGPDTWGGADGEHGSGYSGGLLDLHTKVNYCVLLTHKTTLSGYCCCIKASIFSIVGLLIMIY